MRLRFPFSRVNPRECRDIPNKAGFDFIAVLLDGSTRAATVAKREDGTHYVPGTPVSEMKGWLQCGE